MPRFFVFWLDQAEKHAAPAPGKNKVTPTNLFLQ
jgi:hypothetical protein